MDADQTLVPCEGSKGKRGAMKDEPIDRSSIEKTVKHTRGERESDLQRRIRHQVASRYPYAWVLKLSERYRRGVPDMVIVFLRWIGSVKPITGVGVLFVENKTLTGQVTVLQQHEIDRINRVGAGCKAIVARDVNHVLNTLQEMGAIHEGPGHTVRKPLPGPQSVRPGPDRTLPGDPRT